MADKLDNKHFDSLYCLLQEKADKITVSEMRLDLNRKASLIQLKELQKSLEESKDKMS